VYWYWLLVGYVKDFRDKWFVISLGVVVVGGGGGCANYWQPF
jgi:hypothetical protein